MLFFLHGNDTYRSRKKLQEIREKFSRERDATGLNSEVLQGSNLTVERFAKSFTTAPFMATRRLVVIENALTENSDVSLHEALFTEMKARPSSQSVASEDPILVFWEGAKITPPVMKGKKRKEPRTLKEQLFTGEYVQEFKPLSGRGLSLWLSEEASGHGCTLTRQAAALLGDWYGTDSWRLASELEKTCAYTLGIGKTIIDDKAIRVVGEIQEEVRAFVFGNALAERNETAALEIFWEHIRDGESPFKLFVMITTQFRQLLALARNNNSTSIAELAKALGVHPYALQKTSVGIRRYTVEEIQQNYRQLVAVERELRSGNCDQALTLARFLHRALARSNAS